MGWNLDSRFTIGHGVLVKPAKTVHHIWTCDSVTVREKRKKWTTCKNFNTFRRKLRKHRCQVPIFGWKSLKVARVSRLHLNTHLTQHLTFLPARLHSEQTNVMTRWYRAVLLWSSRQRPATTTLPSEGHQNVLVNAAFVLRPGGVALGSGAVCTAPTTAVHGVEGGGWKRSGGGSKRPLYTCRFHLWG